MLKEAADENRHTPRSHLFEARSMRPIRAASDAKDTTQNDEQRLTSRR